MPYTIYYTSNATGYIRYTTVGGRQHETRGAYTKTRRVSRGKTLVGVPVKSREQGPPPRKHGKCKKGLRALLPNPVNASFGSSRLPHPCGRILGQLRRRWADFGPLLNVGCLHANFHVTKAMFWATYGIYYVLPAIYYLLDTIHVLPANRSKKPTREVD